MDAGELYRAGRFQDAIDAASAEVKAKPADAAKRAFLCDLLCCAGDFERADKQLDALAHVRPELAVTVAMSRQLIRAARWRQQVFADGRLPEFAGKPSPTLERHLEALVHLRAGDVAAAAALLAQAEAGRAAVAGVCDAKPFRDLRDLDDLLAPFFEVFTATGKYYWIAIDQVTSLECEPVKRIRDLLWRPANIMVKDGPEGAVSIPVLYPGSENASDDAIRLARLTTWSDDPHGPVRGLGQRMLLIDDEPRPFLEVNQLSVAASQAGEASQT